MRPVFYISVRFILNLVPRASGVVGRSPKNEADSFSDPGSLVYKKRSASVTCDRAQQVPMQPTMDPANVKIAEKPATMRMARKQLSITLMSSQLCTVRLK